MDWLPDCKTLFVMDIEYTVWDRNTPERSWGLMETIQIALLALDRETLEYRDEFSCFVRPALYPLLSKRFQDLTGITQEEVDLKGLSLEDAFGEAELFIDHFDQPCRVVSNGVDGKMLFENATVLGIPCPEQLKNSKPISAFIRECIPQYDSHHCSGDLAELVGDVIPGSKHDALYDVKSIASGLRYIRDQGY